MKVIWTTQDGRKIPVSEMEDTHLLNTIKFIQRKRRCEEIDHWEWNTEEQAMIYEAIKRNLVEKRFCGWQGWEGVGYCRARHRRAKDDFCNNKAIPGGQYCGGCTCGVEGCKDNWVRCWLLLGNKALCSHHSKHPPEGKWSRLVEAANAPPDDFDIPDDDW